MTQAENKPALNGFEQHGIKHSSASSVNLWSNAPDVYIANKLMGVTWPPNPAMFRGIECENAVVNVLTHDWAHDLAIETAVKQFNKKCVLWPDREKVAKEEATLIGCFEQAIIALEGFGKPTFMEGDQVKTNLMCNGDGWTLPIIGFLDLMYPQHKKIIDLKTSLKMPGRDKEAEAKQAEEEGLEADDIIIYKLSPEHNRQACIYAKSMEDQGYEVEFLYCTPKKHGFAKPNNVDGTLADIKTILNRQEKFLSISKDPQVLADIIPVNPTTFYWGSDAAAEACRKLYNL